MPNERFSSWLIDEGAGRRTGSGSLSRTLLAAVVVIAAGVLFIWLLLFFVAHM